MSASDAGRRPGRWVAWAAASLAAHAAVLGGGFLLVPASAVSHRGPMVVSVEWVPMTPVRAAPPSKPEALVQRQGRHAVARRVVGEPRHASTADTGHGVHAAVAHPQASAAKAASAASDAGAPASSQAMAHNLNLVRQHLERFKFYPDSARRRGIGGNVDVGFRLTEGGRVTQLRIATSSGYALLDEAAETIVTRAVPFPVDTGQYRVRLRFWP